MDAKPIPIYPTTNQTGEQENIPQEWESKKYNPFFPTRKKLGRPYTFKEMEIKDLNKYLFIFGSMIPTPLTSNDFKVFLIDDNSIDNIEISGKNIVFLIDWNSLLEKNIQYFNVNSQSHINTQISNYGIKRIEAQKFSVKQISELSEYEYLLLFDYTGNVDVTLDFNGAFINPTNNEGVQNEY